MIPRRQRPRRGAVASLAAALALGAACATGSTPATPAPAPGERMDAAASLDRGLRIAQRYRVGAIDERRFTHEELWRALAPSLTSPHLTVEEIGRSVEGRPLRAITFGGGPTTVLLWSQMHGDESTATMALADILRYLAEAEGDSLRERLRRELTIVLVPMLNPDGAERFERENAVGIDINRDARRLATPEGRALEGLRDRIRPEFGFNLHDQSARTRAGAGGPVAAIALLAPPATADRAYGEVRSRARLVASAIARTLALQIPTRIAKYDDTFNPRAFGDLMQQWGTSTVLIESGALPDDPQKQRLRALNVAGILTALDAIATGRYAAERPETYESLPFNRGGASDLLLRGGRIVLPGREPVEADVAINYEDAVARTGGRVREVGDLRDVEAVDTIDVSGLFLHPDSAAVTEGALAIGAPALFEVRRDSDRASELVRRIGSTP